MSVKILLKIEAQFFVSPRNSDTAFVTSVIYSVGKRS